MEHSEIKSLCGLYWLINRDIMLVDIHSAGQCYNNDFGENK